MKEASKDLLVSSLSSTPIRRKLTKSEAMDRVRQRLKDYAASFLTSSNDFDKQFVEKVNQLTFNDDERFAKENIFFGDSERVPHKHVRDVGCGGGSTHVEGQRLRVGDNVEGNFAGKGSWYPAHVTKIHRGKYDLQYSGRRLLPRP